MVQVGSQFDVYDVRKSGNIRKFEHYTLVSIIPSRNKFLGIAVKDYANAYNSFFKCFPTWPDFVTFFELFSTQL